jgi:hypothetical protein
MIETQISKKHKAIEIGRVLINNNFDLIDKELKRESKR